MPLPPALFSDFSMLCLQLEQTQSRKALIGYLASFFKAHDLESIVSSIYLLQGLLQAPYIPLNLGVSEALMTEILALASGRSKEELKKMLHTHGDIGTVAEHLPFEETQLSFLTLPALHQALISCAHIQGDRSQEKKSFLLADILKKLPVQQRKYATRLMVGTMRLGVSDATLLKGLCAAYTFSKKEEELVTYAYRLQSDLGKIARILISEGLPGLQSHLHPELHIPVQCALTERAETANEVLDRTGIPCIAQPKYDGLRIQIHVDYKNKKISFFSRNLLPMHDMFPELHEELLELCNEKHIENIILDGEIIGFDPIEKQYKSFQETAKRRRIYNIANQQKDIPIRFIIFDCLYYHNHPCMHEPYTDRLERIKNIITKHIFTIQSTLIKTCLDLQSYFEKYTSQGYEGIIIKKIDSIYEPGKRTFSWIKWKRIHSSGACDTVDAVIVGYFYGKGKRSSLGIGALLVALYNEKRACFQTIAKIGTGMDEETWVSLKAECDKCISSEIPPHLMCKKTQFPDVWCSPTLVVSLKADELSRSSEHTCDIDEHHGYGLALRFPRLVAIRPDKNAYQTTSVSELSTIYKEKSLPSE